MKQKKSIANLVTDLQKENEKLQYLGKLFNSACKHEFGYDVREIHQLIDKQQWDKSGTQSSSPDSIDSSEDDKKN